SPNRRVLGLDTGLRYSGYTAWRGVTASPIDLDNAAGETWGRGRIFGLVPLPNDRLYWFATLNTSAQMIFDNEPHVVSQYFGHWHSPIPACLAATIQLSNKGSEFMKFVVNGESESNYAIPEQLTTIEKIDPDEAVRTKEFVFQGMGPMVNINGKQMDINRIEEFVDIHETEIWEVSNESGMGMMGGTVHPFHAHGVQFQIIDRDGNPPPLNETGWKDTFIVYPGEKVRAIATFNHSGVFMYHCHILEHEDAGMMGQFKVE